MLNTLEKKKEMEGWNGRIAVQFSPTSAFNHAGLLYVDHAPSLVPDLAAEEEDPQQKRLKDGSGLYIDNANITGYAGTKDRYGSGDDDKTPDEKEADKKRLAELLKALGEVLFDKDDVTSHLRRRIAMDQAFLQINNAHMKPITDQDMLRDEKGNIVQTVEEKRKMEERDKACTIYFAQEEVTMKDGRLVSAEEYNRGEQLKSSIAEKSNILDQLNAGKLKLEDVPDYIKEDVAKEKKEAAAPQKTPAIQAQPGILDQISTPSPGGTPAAASFRPDWTPKPMGL